VQASAAKADEAMATQAQTKAKDGQAAARLAQAAMMWCLQAY
jgi:hypothetical protein